MAKKAFQTEIKQLLDLMIHSLYSNKEIFLRELISNASDALDKLNHLTLSDEAYKQLVFNPKITISFDSEKKILKIADNGIGMNEEDLNNNLGTIAKSGTKNFLENLSGDKKKDSNLIGQFGVGFYSSFMVAEKIIVNTKKALDSQAYTWISSGDGEYEILESSKDEYGTEITLYLKDDANQYCNKWGIEDIIKRYSNHIQFPIFLHYTEEKKEEGKDEATKVEKEEQINKAKALWTITKSELKREDYEDFFTTLSYDKEKPLSYIHTHAEGKLQYKSLFYIPATAPFDMQYMDYKSHVKLYVKCVFITDDNKELLPSYLRFIHGIIDSDDLPLNVSREILQENTILEQVKKASVKKVLSMIESLSKDDKKYKEFYAKYGKVLKEGLHSDYENKEKLLQLMRAYSFKKGENISLKEYKEQMGAEQKGIFYAVGKDLDTLKNNPILEKFANYDVLLFADPVDGFVIPGIGEFDGKKLIDIASKEASEDIKSEISEDVQKAFEPLIESFKSLEGVHEVSLSSNLTSPLALTDEGVHNSYMEQIMQQMGQTMPEPKKNVEININHELVQKMRDMPEDLRKKYSLILFNGAKILEGQNLKDSKSYVDSVHEILLKNI